MDKSWAVLKVQPRQELLAAEAVRARGVESYVPLLRPRRSTDRAAPLFPGYLFARIAPLSDDLLRIRSAPGVAYVLPRGAPPTLFPDAVLDEIRHRLAAPAYPSARQPFQTGDRVTVVSGPFRWLDAVFDRHMNAAGRVRILLQFVHRTVPVEIQEECLKRVS